MDTASNALLIITSVSVAHERALELARWIMERLRPSAPRFAAVLDQLTKDGWAVLPAITMALVTRANLLDAFTQIDGRPRFFDTFLGAWPQSGDLARWFIGCVLMGLAVAYGSTFSHDLAKGLMDVRAKLRETKNLELPPPSPPTNT